MPQRFTFSKETLASDLERGDGSRDGGLIGAGVGQRADQHIAANPGECVQIAGNGHCSFIVAQGARPLHAGQDAVDHVDADRALSDGGGDALHVAGAHVADGEDAGQAGFEHEGRTRERPAESGVGDMVEVVAGDDEAFVVEGEAAVGASRCAARRRS